METTTSKKERHYNNERNAAIKEIIEIGEQHHYGVPRHIALEIFHELEYHPEPDPDDVLYEIERRFNDKRGTFQCQQCREADKGQSFYIAKPIFTDKDTSESEAEKIKLYEQYRQDGEDLYELKITAHAYYPDKVDCNEWIHHNFTFAKYTEATAYAEMLNSKFDDHYYQHQPTLPVVRDIANFTNQRAEIYEITPTETGEALVLSADLKGCDHKLEWINHEEPTELGGYAA